MKTFPLFKTRLSNERLMSALVAVLLLFNIPRFLSDPVGIGEALVITAAGLFIDAVSQYMVHKRLMCAVSASVTALILFTLSPGVPLLMLCAAAAVSVIIGKSVWGGTGKNPFNPAMAGLVFLGLFYPVGFPVSVPALMLPAALLALPFMLMRPYASLGYMAGMAAALLTARGLSPASLAGRGIIFWGCLVITDPVTTTSKPAAGFVIGLLAGFVPGMLGGTGLATALGILASNVLSFLADHFDIGAGVSGRQYTFGKTQKIRFSPADTPYIDLTDSPEDDGSAPDLSGEEILSRIESSGVFGCGGAAFPAGRKIRAVLKSPAQDKHLIVNAAECDPGLIHDKWLLVRHAADIQKGIGFLTKIIPFKSATIAAKEFYGAQIMPSVTACRIRDYYPAGSEKLLIRDILKKASDGEAPAEAGILVLNIQTVFAIYEAVCKKRKADTRFLTVADVDALKGTVVRAPLGADVHETAGRILHAANIFTGGGAMGARLAGDGDAVAPTTNFIAAGTVRGFREAACSRCDICSACCPSGLRVRNIAQLVDAGKQDMALKMNPEKCMDCALCSALCLAGRDLAARVRAARQSAAKTAAAP